LSVQAFLLIAAGVQVLLVTLDLVDRHLTRKTRYGGQPLETLTVLFLLVVLLTYLAVQYAGFALVPSSADLLAAFGHAPARQASDGPWPWIMVIGVFYLAGLWDYLVHRFLSHSRWLWFTHEYHHLPSQVFVVMPGLAARPFAVVTTFPVTVGTIACTQATLIGLGQPAWDLKPLTIVLLIQVGILTASHSCCLRRWWWIHRVMAYLALTTPHEHVLHHTVDLDGNYGNLTTLWDRLLGTYLDPTLATHRGRALGLAYDQDFLGALTAGRVKLPTSVRVRFQVARYCNLAFPAPK
jgi:sterol desaturase/sphingolipid hydroxylase (fatty acid hydroxylase superfamily)